MPKLGKGQPGQDINLEPEVKKNGTSAKLAIIILPTHSGRRSLSTCRTDRGNKIAYIYIIILSAVPPANATHAKKAIPIM